MSTVKKVIELLFGENDFNSEKEAILAASILHSRKCWDTEGVKLVGVLSSSEGSVVLEWGMLVEIVSTCFDTILSKYCTRWTHLITAALQTTLDPAVLAIVLRGVASLLARNHKSPGAVRDFNSLNLPSILQSCMCFSEAGPHLQAAVMGVVSQALVMFPAACSNQKSSIKKWAATAVFNTHVPLSQEASRVVVVLCRHSNQHWVGMVTDVLSLLESTQKKLHRRKCGDTSNKSSPCLTPPATPTTDPMRTACLVQQCAQLSRTMCYSLLFPPMETATPPPVPLERVLNVVSCGLRPPREGHTVECLVLQAAIPILHTAMCNLLHMLIKTCHAHLLPYSNQIMSLLVTSINSREAQQSPALVSAVHRTLSAWVGVARDYDAVATPPILRCLLSSINHTHLCESSLEAISVLVEWIGPSLPSAQAAAVLRVPMEYLTPYSPPRHALLLLRILKGCVASRHVHLSPPLGATLHLLAEIQDHHGNREVAEECRNLMLLCSLLIHPSIAPLVVITASTTTPQPLMSTQHPTPLMQPSPSPHITPTPLMQPSPSPHNTPPPLMQPPPSPPPSLMQVNTALPQTQSSLLPLMQSQPPPTPLMQAQPPPTPLMQTQPPPIPLIQTQPSPLPLMQTQPPPLPLMQATSSSIHQSRALKRRRSPDPIEEVWHDDSSDEASGVELFVEDSADTDDA